jgi:hypothetical protein
MRTLILTIVLLGLAVPAFACGARDQTASAGKGGTVATETPTPPAPTGG